MKRIRILTASCVLLFASHSEAFEAATAMELVAELINANYADVDKAARCAAAIRDLDAEHALFAETDPAAFSEAVTEFLRTTCEDRHFRLKPRAKGVVAAPNAGTLVQYLDSQEDANGFLSVTRTEDNVAVIRIGRFYGTAVARNAAVGAMRLSDGADAFVIDLRGNPGGSRSMVRFLASHFLKQSVQLNAFIDRSGAVTEELWSLAEVDGPRFPDQPLYIVVDPKTGSAAEAFSYHLQALGRAVVVGEPTAGGANPGDVFRVGEDFTLFVSTQISRNPVTGRSWEGDGVQPDVVRSPDTALPEAETLAAAQANKKRAARREAIDAAVGRVSELLDEASLLRRNGEWADAARVQKQIAETELLLDYLWLDVGLAYHFNEDYVAAEAAYRHALEVPSTRVVAMYQLACINALDNNIDESIRWLEAAFAAGFEEDSFLVQDSDLDALHGDPRFQQLLASRHLD